MPYNEEFFTPGGDWDQCKALFKLLIISSQGMENVDPREHSKLLTCLNMTMGIIDDSREQLLKERREHAN